MIKSQVPQKLGPVSLWALFMLPNVSPTLGCGRGVAGTAPHCALRSASGADPQMAHVYALPLAARAE